MINLEFHLADGTSAMVYDVHPESQAHPVPIPAGAVSVTIWLGTRSVMRRDIAMKELPVPA